MHTQQRFVYFQNDKGTFQELLDAFRTPYKELIDTDFNHLTQV